MKALIVRRLVSFIPVLLGVVTITFMLMHLLPGDPAAVMLSRSGASAEQIAQLREELGLNEPLHIQYLKFIANAVRGDFGVSIWTRRPVMTMIAEQLPSTLKLAFTALIVSVVSGTLLGVLAAVYRDSWIDRLSIVLSTLGVSMPMFWSSLLLILLFATTLRWLPSTGQGSLRHLILPATVLGFATMGTTTRTVRSSMVEVLCETYVTTARAKGLREVIVIGKHALRNALIPTVTVVGLQFGWLIGGTVVVERVFGRQGIGHLLVEAVLWKDFPVVQGGVLVAAVMYLTLNLFIDLLYGFIDPRIRYD